MKSIIKWGLVLGLALTTAWAQDYEKVAPKTPPRKTGNKPIAAPPARPGMVSGATEEVLVPKLNGLVVLSSPSELDPRGQRGITGLQLHGPEFLQGKGFEAIVAPYFGQAMSMSKIKGMQRDIILYCRAKDHPVIDVILPEQEIVDGVIQLVVMEGKVGKVEVKNEGKKWFADAFIASRIRLHPGDSIRQSKLEDDINWLNRNPYFREVNVAYKQGDLGKADLELRVKDRFPLRVFAGYEDSGNAIVGNDRLFAGVNWGNAWGVDHQFNYQYTTDYEMKYLKAHSASYIAPLPWRHILTLYGLYSEVNGNMQAVGFSQFQNEGQSYQASVRYEVPLPRIKTYNHSVSVGFDFKRTDNNFEFGGSSIFHTPTDVDQLLAGYWGSSPDRWGRTGIGAEVYYSPGNWTTGNRDFNFGKTRPNATADYYYVQLNAERVTKLPLTSHWQNQPSSECFSWAVAARIQLTDCLLLPSEQMGLGGYATVRGYDERLVNGDRGWLISNELRTPALHLGNLTHAKDGLDTLQFLAFFDAGSVHLNDNITDPNLNLASVGGGLRFTINRNLSLRFDYGFQLSERELSQKNSRAHLGIIASY